MKPNEIYDFVTSKIINILESKLEGNWSKPWIGIDSDSEPARNPTTKAYYKGINQFILSLIGMELGYLKNEYATYKQISDLGGHVKKGEKAIPVVFYKTAYIDDNKKYYSLDVVKNLSQKELSEKGIQVIPILKLYQVFNLQMQTEGLSEQFYEVPQAPKTFNDIQKNESAENLIKQTGAIIEYKLGDRAFYNRQSDTITLPLREQFNSVEDLYSSALHELIHWSGASHRLNRVKGKVFGDRDYSQEEIIAELGASLLCANLGFEKQITNNAAYIKGWLTVLKEDNKAIFKASAEAQKACDYILNGAEAEIYNESLALENLS